MAAKIVQFSAVVTVLLVLSVQAVAQDYDADQRQMLFGLFETALVNDSYALWQLQHIFFNPDAKQSPEQVCLSIFVRVDSIANPDRSCDSQNGAAFDGSPGEWHFDSYYELQQQVADDASDTSELAKLMTKSGSTGVFYAMDPSFYSIMKTLSNFIALSLPYRLYDGSFYNKNYAGINIAIHTALDEMPCWDDAVYALRSVLMWVSFHCPQKLILILM